METFRTSSAARQISGLKSEPLRRLSAAEPHEDESFGWDYTNGNADSYQSSFKEVLRGKTILELVGEIKERTGKATVLDLMSYTSFLRNIALLMQLDRGVAVSLGDDRTDAGKIFDATMNITQLQGNILGRSTWNAIWGLLRSQEGDTGFGLITARPYGGLAELTEDKRIHYLLLKRAWNLLVEDGVLLTQLPLYYRSRTELTSLVHNWVATLNHTEGITAQYHMPSRSIDPYSSYTSTFPSLALTKSRSAPKELPALELS